MNSHSDIRIGTLAGKGAQTPHYIRQILPHGFESFQINFWKTIPGDVNLKTLAAETKAVFNEAGSDAIVSSLGVFGNPIEDKQTAKDFARAIEAAPLFGCDLVCGFSGCLDGQPVPAGMKAFKKTWGPLVKRATEADYDQFRGAKVGLHGALGRQREPLHQPGPVGVSGGPKPDLGAVQRILREEPTAG